MDVKAAEDFVKEFKRLVESEGYMVQQVFNCDGTGLFWKRCQRRPTSLWKKRRCSITNQ